MYFWQPFMPVFKGSISSKLPKVGTTIFTTMSALAAEHKAINLAQGFPDYEPEPELLELVRKYHDKGFNQYAPMQGALPLRQILSFYIEQRYGLTYNPFSEITVTAGATQAIFTAILALVGEGDEVVVFTPAYDCYEPAIELAGAKPVYVQLKSPDYKVDWSEVKKLVSRKTRMIIINTPHNPTGTVFSKQDMMELEKLTANSDIVVLSDEVYEHMVFDGGIHHSVCRYPKLAERALAVSSFGKNFHATGWKLGYIACPENLMAEFNKVHQYNVFAANHPLQMAIADFIGKKGDFHYLSTFYQEKRDLFRNLLQQSRLKLLPSKGSYFQLADFSAVSDESDVDFCVRLTKEIGVAAIPVSVFYPREYDEKVVRFCFAKKEETLQAAAELLNKI
jgi:methionine transaminase